jgi:hypothetical protein
MKEYTRGGKAYCNICVEDERIQKRRRSIGILVLRMKDYSRDGSIGILVLRMKEYSRGGKT